MQEAHGLQKGCTTSHISHVVKQEEEEEEGKVALLLLTLMCLSAEISKQGECRL